MTRLRCLELACERSEPNATAGDIVALAEVFARFVEASDPIAHVLNCLKAAGHSARYLPADDGFEIDGVLYGWPDSLRVANRYRVKQGLEPLGVPG